ncbi:cupin domain-containing protein [Trinickia sp. EG282A]|uniref:cupin domain-containing protein n=1 Tax=Trinickia sp. EG282A TaxID=3237013 RepID=UPI0034D29930
MVTKSEIAHYSLGDLPVKALGESITQQIVNGKDLTLSLLTLKSGATVARHAHPHEQLTYIMQGTVAFRVGEALEHEFTVRAGEMLHIPANVPHSAHALEDTLDLDIFSPRRTDWMRPGGEDNFHNH